MPTPLLEHDLIRTFVSVCETGSFKAAAERVRRTPSAVSMQMARLEDQLTTRLFEKSGRSVALSSAGEELLNYARRILSLNEEAVSRFLGPRLSGLVRVGAPDDYETRLLPPTLARFSKLCPEAEIELVLGLSPTLVERLGRGELDIAFVAAEAAQKGGLPGEILHAEPLVWLGRAGGTAMFQRPVPLALPGYNCPWRHMAVEALERAGIAYRTAFSCEYSHGQMAALMADLAISPLPASYITPQLERASPDLGLPALGNVATHMCLRPGADDLTHTLASVARETLTTPNGSMP
ncbi:LysR substrate-binding domain-containing protein [Acuticoccus mangrovi]|uniref:LysR family transcriptional regulator n=1 Tax=Acuticoccus mangrovi TaxID=2796142 RepID=A0A934IPN3_9HYPH|nr:LysR substrate-binding domain-containing protein [Acuticoccus mangrovi]MBJ3776288.1 LysR family transcriptional regulator [Acuticoccus mangrovi]